MADYRQVHTKMWTDAWFLELEPASKLLWIYLFSNKRACLSGLYDIPLRVIMFETGLSSEAIASNLETFTAAGKAYYEDGWVLIPKLMRYNANGITGQKIQANLRNDVFAAPNIPLKRRWLDEYNSLIPPDAAGCRMTEADIGYNDIPDTVSDRVSDRVYDRVSDTVPIEQNITEHEQDKKGASARPPDFLRLQFEMSVPVIKDMQLTRSQWEAVLQSEKDANGRKTLIEWIDSKLHGGGHPAVVAYREEMEHNPRKNQYKAIIAAIGETGKMDVWRGVVRDWKLYGWNPYNIAGMIDAFKAGGVQAKPHGGNDPPQQATPLTDYQDPDDFFAGGK